MELLQEIAGWFVDPANWSGRDAIPQRTLEHVLLSGGALLAGLLVALPIALYIGHTGRGAFVAISLTNVGRALPSYALLVILFGFFVQNFADRTLTLNGPTFLAMAALAIPPIVTNAYAGLSNVDRELIESARGMGMTGSQLLRRVELPLALPVIIVGVRIAAVQVIATAALGAIIGGGGLGRYIIQGIARQDEARLAGGALLVILLALVSEAFFIALQRLVVSPGLGRAGEADTRRAAKPGAPGG